MIGNVAQRDAADGRDVMKEPALMLGKVSCVRLEESAPQPTVQEIELFGCRFVRHGVQSTTSAQDLQGG